MRGSLAVCAAEAPGGEVVLAEGGAQIVPQCSIVHPAQEREPVSVI